MAKLEIPLNVKLDSELQRLLSTRLYVCRATKCIHNDMNRTCKGLHCGFKDIKLNEGGECIHYNEIKEATKP